MSLKRDILIRASLVYILMLLAGLLIFAKAMHLQFFEKDKWAQEENSTVRHKVIEPNRGNIYSADNRLLAVSMSPSMKSGWISNPNPSAMIFFMVGSTQLSKSLSGLFNDRHWSTYKRELVRARENGDRYYLVKRNVSYTQLQQVKKFPIIQGGHGSRVVSSISRSNKRVRPYGMLAARTVGYTMSGNAEVWWV